MGRRYNGYRGKSGAREAVRVMLVVLILLLVLAAAGLMIGQRYIIYTDDGVRLELPFFRREASAPTDADRSISLEVERRAEPSEDARPDGDESNMYR